MSSKKKRTLLIGDIHGCYKEFKELLQKLEYNPKKDRLISLGDLVHKGPKSWKILEFFFENKLEVIMGNHDWYFLKFLKDENVTYKEGEKILKKCSIPKEDLVEWIDSFPFYIEEDDFIAVHAAFDTSKKKFSSTSKDNMISARYFNVNSHKMVSSRKQSAKDFKPWYHVYDNKKLDDKITVFGHWAQPLPRIYKNFRCIDTGCCYGGHLSCLILPDDKIVRVKSKQAKKFNY